MRANDDSRETFPSIGQQIDDALAGYGPAVTRGVGRLQRIALGILVHVEALFLHPAGYLKALGWRALGRRLRAHNQIASLAGRTPHAYQLWICAREKNPALQAVPPTVSEVPILPIILSNGSCEALQITLDSVKRAGGPDPLIVEGTQLNRVIPVLERTIDDRGQWLCFLFAGDQLAESALPTYRRAVAANPDVWVIYADDDLIVRGRRRDPHFKPDWNPELFENHDFLSGSAIVRVTREILARIDDQTTFVALVRELLIKGEPLHIPAVLHHRESRPQPQLPSKPAKPPAADLPPVSVIVPTRNQFDLLRDCVEGVRRTAYPMVELIVIDNGSDDPQTLDYLRELARDGVRVFHQPGPFNYSKLNNAAAAAAQHDFLCFLNNDIEITDPDWLWLMVLQAARSDIGAVGARLLYPDGTVQHAGVVTGVGGGAAHAHRYARDDESGYFKRDRLPQRVSAVTGACLVVAKEKFLAVRGFDEIDFPVAFNDVDLCLKLNDRGWQSFYEARAVLIHHESKSRGKDSAKPNRERFARELAALKRKWSTDHHRDPYHHPELSPYCENFYIAL